MTPVELLVIGATVIVGSSIGAGIVVLGWPWAASQLGLEVRDTELNTERDR